MTDSFAPVTRTPDHIGPLEIVLLVEAGDPKVYAGRYTFDVLDAAGAVIGVRSGNLVPHLTTTQVNSVKAFLDAMLTKAEGAIV